MDKDKAKKLSDMRDEINKRQAEIVKLQRELTGIWIEYIEYEKQYSDPERREIE